MPRASNIYIATGSTGGIMFASTVKYELTYWFERLSPEVRRYVSVVRMRDGMSALDWQPAYLREKDILD